MRGIFRFLSIFDWITPLWSIADDICHDPMMINSWSFFVPYGDAIGGGWDAASINRLLKQHGIGAYGKLYAPYAVGWDDVGEQYMFSVPLDQARWAEYVLLKNGVPLTDSSLGVPGEGPLTIASEWDGGNVWNLWGLV